MKGNLEDFSLTGLIQVMCSERRQITLIVRHPHFKEGIICFYQGEIIHAQMESLIGIEAMYHLLSWQRGKFRTVKLQQIPQRTIKVPWRHILLEAMKKVDEGQLGEKNISARKDTLSLAQVEHDNELEMGLITLLSKLEYQNTQLTKKKFRSGWLDVMKIMVEMINKSVDFVDSVSGDRARNLDELIDECYENHPTLRLLSVQGNRLSMDVVNNMYVTNSTSRQVQKDIGLNTLNGLHDLLEVMLMFIVSLFYSFVIADQCREMCSVFLDDVKNAYTKVAV